MRDDCDIATAYDVLRPEPDILISGSVDWPGVPHFNDIRALVEPLLMDEMKYARVYYGGEIRDMFVGAHSALKNLPANEAATVIYYGALKAREPDVDVTRLRKVRGPAVLFTSRRVFFAVRGEL